MTSPSSQTNDDVCDFKLEAQLMRHSHALHAYLEKKIPSGLRRVISPDDILQEVWMVATVKLSGHADTSDDGAWLMNVTKNKLADAIKRAMAAKRGGGRFEYNVRPADSEGTEPFAFATSPQRTPSSEDAAREATRAVQSAIRVLPDRYREAVTLRYLHDEPLPAIAGRLRSTVPATRSLLYRGIQMLRGRLGPAWRFFSDDGSVDSDQRAPDHVQEQGQTPTRR